MYKTCVRMTSPKLLIFSFINIFLIFRVEIIFLPYFLEILAVVVLFCALLKNYNRRFSNVGDFIFLYLLLICLALTTIIINSGEYAYLRKLISIVYKLA